MFIQKVYVICEPSETILIVKKVFSTNSTSSCPEMFCKKNVPNNFAKFTGKHLCQSLFLNKVAGLSLQLY